VDKHPFGEFEVKGKTVNLSDYGGVESWSYTVENPLRFPGQYNDYNYRSVIISGKKGPYYNYHRWYNPGIGRYMEVDTNITEIIGYYDKTEYIGHNIIIHYKWSWFHFNSYSYVVNNPVIIIDKNGESVVSLIGGGILIIIMEPAIIEMACLLLEKADDCKRGCPYCYAEHMTEELKRLCDQCIAQCGLYLIFP
jgi:RHS repeat-associated protein